MQIINIKCCFFCQAAETTSYQHHDIESHMVVLLGSLSFYRAYRYIVFINIFRKHTVQFLKTKSKGKRKQTVNYVIRKSYFILKYAVNCIFLFYINITTNN